MYKRQLTGAVNPYKAPRATFNAETGYPVGAHSAAARALVHQPAAVLADEPTGNLDSKNGAAIFDLMLAIRREFGTAFVLATHDPALMAQSPRRIELKDGRILSDRREDRAGA